MIQKAFVAMLWLGLMSPLAYCQTGASHENGADVTYLTISPMIITNVLAKPIIVERGPNHRVWGRVSCETNAGQVIWRTNRAYTELETGMHFWNGQWTESQEVIELTDKGAQATNGQNQIYFPADIYEGVIKLVTADKKILRSRPMGISYFSGTNSLLLAELTHSIGQILPSGNQVIYTNCFSDLEADLLCTYRKSGFECDLVFRTPPPPPEDFGLDSAGTRLQLLTEFFDTPDPVGRVDSTRLRGQFLTI